MPLQNKSKSASNLVGLAIAFLVIELLDELVDGVRGSAWPLIRTDLHLSYVQVGLVLTIPNTISSLIEPILGIWADVGQRRQLILGGGVMFAIALLLISLSQNFALFLTGFVLFYPSSGSFVSLSQATLMDIDPARHEQNMARWALVGSLGNVIGPVILTGVIALDHSWRSAFFSMAVLTGLILALLWQYPIALPVSEERASVTATQSDSFPHRFKGGIKNAIAALKRSVVLRWLMLLQFSDLMLDVLHGFVALYFVDVVGATSTQASLAIAVWLGLGLLGDFLLIPLLERVRGLSYLRVSVFLVLSLYPAFLVVSNFTVKLVILGCLGLLNSGWYSILQGQLYSAMPGQSGTVMTLSNVFGLVGGLAPLMLGILAQQVGLQNTMWILLAAPIALLIGLVKWE
jgi:MFS transporter, FSR family, fosmidomycin resistance protein